MNAQRLLSLSLLLVFALSNSVVAQESKSSSWWSFGSSKSKEETRPSSFYGASTTKAKSSGSSMFKLPSWSKSKTKSKSKSSFSKMGSTTKKWMNNTADFLNPFNDSKPKVSQAHGYQADTWANRKKPKEEESSGMFGWMWKETEEPKISTVNDFLKQDMPY